MSFDVESLFTSVILEKTIAITLEPIYLRKKIEIVLTKNEMKNLLLLCTRNVHFTFTLQKNGLTMGSPLGLKLAGIFKVELENTVVSK